MKGATRDDYIHYHFHKGRAAFRARNQELTRIAKTTPQEFWDVAYAFDPIGDSIKCGDTKLVSLLSSKRVKAIYTAKHRSGSFQQSTVCPCPRSKLKYCTTFPVAQTDFGAIYYSDDGHPSLELEEGGWIRMR